MNVTTYTSLCDHHRPKGRCEICKRDRRIAELEAERDEALAEVERLRTESAEAFALRLVEYAMLPPDTAELWLARFRAALAAKE